MKVKKKIFSKIYIVPLVIFCISLVFTFHTRLTIFNGIKTQGYTSFVSQTDDYVALINKRLEFYSTALYSLRGLSEACPVFDKLIWNNFISAEGLIERYPGIISIAYVSRVKNENKEVFEQKVRDDNSLQSERYKDFHIITDHEKDEYYVATYTYPLNAGTSPLGRDLTFETERTKAFEFARDSGQVTATGILQLLIDDTSEGRVPSFFLILPIYEANSPIDTVEQRRDALKGFAIAVFRVKDLINNITNVNYSNTLDVKIYDDTDNLNKLTADNLLYENNLLNDCNDSSCYKTITTFEVGNRIWKLQFRSNDLYGKNSQISIMRIMIVRDIFVNLLIALGIGVIISLNRKLKNN